MELSLKQRDSLLFNIIEKEKKRQNLGINLIASENIASTAVLECLGSCLTNKYSEGLPGHRYYGGTEYIDEIEELCQQRCLDAFQLDSSVWGVNVQPLTGSIANLAVYCAFLKPHDRFMGLLLTDGGHLSHGFYTTQRKISASSIFFESLPYRVDATTGCVDYEALQRDALLYKPKIIICGGSAYVRAWDFRRFRRIADCIGNGCLVMADIAHIAGLVAGGQHTSPFECCDVVTTTTHKTLRGPRSALIFVNIQRLGKKAMDDLNQALFPGLQGGPHNNKIAAVACQMKEVCSKEWSFYAERVVRNAKALAARLVNVHNESLISGGTDNHMVLWDLRPHGITGMKLEKLAEHVGIYVNRNTIPTDKSALRSSGVRLGTPMVTSLGYNVDDMEKVADFLMECVQLCVEINQSCDDTLSAFMSAVKQNDRIKELKERVSAFSVLPRSCATH